MAACNHSLVDYGTFSVWGAYLAQGEVVVADYHRGPANSVAGYLGWHRGVPRLPG